MGLANCLTLCALLLTVCSCFGLSSVPGELYHFGWATGERVWAGPFAFSRANMTAHDMPWAAKKKRSRHTHYNASSLSSAPLFVAGYHESYLSAPTGGGGVSVVTVRWKKCAADYFEEEEEDSKEEMEDEMEEEMEVQEEEVSKAESK